MTVSNGYNQVSVTQVELENGISSGVNMKVMATGMVPVNEEHEARLERGISMDSWYAMNPIERGLIIAVRRIKIAKSNLQAEAEIKKARQKAKKK